jgi:uncharacterized protein (DUF1697 family)
VLAADELAAIVDDNPLTGRTTDPSRMFVGFLQATSDAALLASVSRGTWKPDAVALGRRAVYLSCPDGLMESRLFEAVGKALGDRVTVRNWATTTKLLAVVSR